MQPHPVRILFVCMGNICRSPAGEGVLAKRVAEAGLAGRIEVDSAGTLDFHAGALPDPRMRAAAAKRGFDLTSRARQVEAVDLDTFDLPERLEVELSGVKLAMVHDSGARVGREARLHRWFPEADVVVFGHSHDPLDLFSFHRQLLFNPGSPTQRRRQAQCSFGWLVLDQGRVLEHDVRLLD